MKIHVKVIIGIIAVFVSLAIVGAIVLLRAPTPQPSTNIAISYISSMKQSIEWLGESGSHVEQSDPGKVFLEVNMTIKNNGYDSFSANPLYFYAVVDNVTYSIDSITYFVVNLDTVNVLDGGTYEGRLVFRIPSTATSFTLGCEGSVYYNIIWTKT